LGSQDSFWATKGPYTGQISPLQLSKFKVKYCLVGHSERRSVGETTEQIKKKMEALIEQNITPILCVGFGTTVEDDDLEVTDVIRHQLTEDLAGIDVEKIIVAYEPVWAISGGNPFATKKVPTPSHASTVALFIKSKFGVKQVLYGGSVNSTNAAGYLAEGYIDGLLVGGASLLPSDFNGIISK
jgi:triosephosphate isomerase